MCVENFREFPFCSTHRFPTGPHDEPVGNCHHCGIPYREYAERSLNIAMGRMNEYGIYTLNAMKASASE